MGRKGLFAEKPKKGPGRKARKQEAPKLTRQFKAVKADKEDAILSHRQKQRLVKRVKKQEEKKILLSGYGRGKKQKEQTKQIKKTYNSDSDNDNSNEEEAECEEEEDAEHEEEGQGFTDDNKEWLKPKQVKKGVIQSAQDSEEDVDSDAEENDDDDDDDVELDEEEQDDEDDDIGSDDDNLIVENLNDLEDGNDLFESDSDDDDVDDDSENDDDDSENDDDSDDLLPIEKKSKKLKIKQEKDAILAEEEMQLGIADQEVFQFPDENIEDADKPITLQVVQQRVKDITLVLSDFKKYRNPDRSRQEYIDLLRKDLCMYYSYNEFLMEKLMEIFPINELMEYLEASEVQRPLTIRTNSLKTRRRELAAALINRGVNLDPLGKWTKVGLVVYNSTVPLGATPEYLAGHYMIQGASSMLPVMALAPQANERILDLCSAPGGKSSHIAAIMKNTGTLFSNDANKDRIKAVVGNFHRLGVINAIVSCEDGCKFKSIMSGFDRILVDAPCTGTGVIAKDPSVKTSKSEVDIQRCYNLQRKLLLTAIDCLSAKSPTGGYLVYSTCSILPEENEWVIDYVLKKRNVKLVPTGLDFGTEGFVNYRNFRFHPSMKLTKRYYPHTHNMDGFFVAKLKKFSDVIPTTNDAVTDDAIADEIQTLENGTEATNGNDSKEKDKLNKQTAAAKKRKQLDETKYVAKVFEKPQAVKKPKLNTQQNNNATKTGKKQKNLAKQTNAASPIAASNLNKNKKSSLPKSPINGSPKTKGIQQISKKTTEPSKAAVNGLGNQTQTLQKPKQKKKNNAVTTAVGVQITKKQVEIDSISKAQATNIKNKLQKPLKKKQIGQLKKAVETKPLSVNLAGGASGKQKNKNKKKN